MKIKPTYITSLLFLFLFISCHAPKDDTHQNIDLSENWEFEMDGKWHPAHVPGTIHTDLYKNNLIPDPFWENNEKELQWIEKRDWVYKTKFIIDDDLFSKKHVEIVFEGLDTYADIFINGEKILTADNMFREWRKDIKAYLKKGGNEIRIKFRSPILKNKETVKNYPHILPSGNENTEIKVSPFTRKAAYQFGWDWGPRFVGCGIWRPVRLEIWDEAKIENIYAHTSFLSKKKRRYRLRYR